MGLKRRSLVKMEFKSTYELTWSAIAINCQLWECSEKLETNLPAEIFMVVANNWIQIGHSVYSTTYSLKIAWKHAWRYAWRKLKYVSSVAELQTKEMSKHFLERALGTSFILCACMCARFLMSPWRGGVLVYSVLGQWTLNVHVHVGL